MLGPLLVALAVLTCPCHLPIWVALLTGTVAGAFLSERLDIVFLLLTVFFIVFATGAWRTLRAHIDSEVI